MSRMTSSSTSSIHKSFRFDVFLSFRGEDARMNFVDHLYYALQQKSIHTYKDDEIIEKGKRISDELIKSIEDSRFYIIVFSKNYASSSWCLEELVKIMERQKTTDHTAYPVFYDVEPSEVRKQSGAVRKAFGKHKKNEAAGKWKEALTEAADLAGWELKKSANGLEAKLIQQIVDKILLELRSINSKADKNLIGMDRINDYIASSLETGFDDMKTNLGKAVIGELTIQCARDVSKASWSGLKSFKKLVLSDVLNDKGINVTCIYSGKNMMKMMMPGRKVMQSTSDAVLSDAVRIEDELVKQLENKPLRRNMMAVRRSGNTYER